MFSSFVFKADFNPDVTIFNFKYLLNPFLYSGENLIIFFWVATKFSSKFIFACGIKAPLLGKFFKSPFWIIFLCILSIILFKDDIVLKLNKLKSLVLSCSSL